MTFVRISLRADPQLMGVHDRLRAMVNEWRDMALGESLWWVEPKLEDTLGGGGATATWYFPPTDRTMRLCAYPDKKSRFFIKDSGEYTFRASSQPRPHTHRDQNYMRAHALWLWMVGA